MRDPNDTRDIGPRVGSPLWIHLTTVTTAGAVAFAAAMLGLHGLTPRAGRPGLAPAVLAARGPDRGRRDLADHHARAVRPGIAGGVGHVQLRGPDLLGPARRHPAARGVHAGRGGRRAQVPAPVGVQRGPGHAQPGRGRAGAGGVRAASLARLAVGPQRPRPVRGAARRGGLLRGQLRPGRRGHRAARPVPGGQDAPGGAALPGVRQPGPAGHRAAGGGGDEHPLGAAGAALRVPAGRHLRQRRHVRAARAPGQP